MNGQSKFVIKTAHKDYPKSVGLFFRDLVWDGRDPDDYHSQTPGIEDRQVLLSDVLGNLLQFLVEEELINEKKLFEIFDMDYLHSVGKHRLVEETKE